MSAQYRTEQVKLIEKYCRVFQERQLVPGATGSVAHEPATIVVDNKPEPRYLNRHERRTKASKQRRKR